MIFKLLIPTFILFSCTSTKTGLDSKLEEENNNKDTPSEKLREEQRIAHPIFFGEYSTQYATHGGVDVFEDQKDLYVATLTRVVDVDMGGTRYHLTYGVKYEKDSDFTYTIIKNSISRFYRTSSSGEKNHIRIIRGKNYVHIAYLSNNGELIHLSSEDGFKEHVVSSNVKVFDMALDKDQNIFFSYIKPHSYYNTQVFIKEVNKAEEIIVTKLNFQYEGSSLNLNFLNLKPVLTTKLYSNSEKTSMFLAFTKDVSWQEYIIARGVNRNGQFNAYLEGASLISCYQNILYDHYRVELDLLKSNYSTNKYNLGYYKAYTNCSASKLSHLYLWRYSNYQADQSYTYSYDNNQSGQYRFNYPTKLSIYKNKQSSSYWILGHSYYNKRMVLIKMD